MIQTLINTGWDDYEFLDSGNGQKFERFGIYKLIRPEPQCLWSPSLPKTAWEKADAVFTRISEDKGTWKTNMPDKWEMRYKDISFFCKLTPFKHTGVFPEQSIHWDWIQNLIIKAKKEINVLNLFGYTGIASLIAAATGAKVTHIDASYPAIGWGRENQTLSGLPDKPIKWILDDVMKFVTREIKRGVRYDGIIMDPPKYGHGPKGERWHFEHDFPKLIDICKELLTPYPLFLLVNAYAISSSSIMLQNVLSEKLADLQGNVESGELLLQESISKRLLSTGIYGHWSKS